MAAVLFAVHYYLLRSAPSSAAIDILRRAGADPTAYEFFVFSELAGFLFLLATLPAVWRVLGRSRLAGASIAAFVVSGIGLGAVGGAALNFATVGARLASVADSSSVAFAANGIQDAVRSMLFLSLLPYVLAPLLVTIAAIRGGFAPRWYGATLLGFLLFSFISLPAPLAAPLVAASLGAFAYVTELSLRRAAVPAPA